MAQKPQSLSERIKAIRAEANALIDTRAAEMAKQYPGVPVGSHRNMITRGIGCACVAALLVAEEIEKETAAKEAAA